MIADDAPGTSRTATGVFALYVGISLPTLVFVLADHRWFFRDDWAFLSGREVSLHGLFTPHFDQHLSAVPVLVFRAMWSLFGANTYLPYQLLIASAHLTIVILLRALLRHLGVRPWLATAAAATLVLWGPAGGDNLTWAFQINFTGSIIFGLGQLLLADHDGRAIPRDVAAVLLGLLSVLSSAIGVTMVAVVACALVVRHGWRSGALQAVPPAAVVLVWTIAMDPATESAAGPPPDLATTLRWVRWSFEGALEGLGGIWGVAIAMTVVAGAGLALRVGSTAPGRSRPAAARLHHRFRPVAVPVAMLAGTILFTVLTARGRWFYGEAGAKAGRYVYVLAVLILPTVGVAAEELARRRPRLELALVLLLLAPIPFNLDGFDDPPFDARYFARQQALLTGTVDMPLARQVPRDNHPPGFDPTMGEDMTIGFLLDAHEQGRLPGAGASLTPKLEDELTIRLAIQQVDDVSATTDCRPIELPAKLTPEAGDTYRIAAPVMISLARSTTDPRARVRYEPRQGQALSFAIDGMEVTVWAPAAHSAALCQVNP